MPIAAEVSEPPEPAGLQRFGRITSSGYFIPEIDGLRFTAILSVLVYHVAGDVLRHSAPAPGRWLQSDWFFAVTQVLNIGVPVFFVISGFLVCAPFAAAALGRRPPVSLRGYARRRFARLVPPYVLSLLVFFALKIAAHKGTASELMPHLAASMFFVHNAIYGEPSAINFVAWSLEIEVQFYVIAPVLACVFLIRRRLLRRGILVALLALTMGVSAMLPDKGAARHSFLGYGQYFVAGLLFAEYILAGQNRRRGTWYWDSVWMGSWVVLIVFAVKGGALIQWTAPLLILLFHIAAFHGLDDRSVDT